MKAICVLIALFTMLGVLVSCKKIEYKDAEKIELGTSDTGRDTSGIDKVVDPIINNGNHENSDNTITPPVSADDITVSSGNTVEEEAVNILLDGINTAVDGAGASFSEMVLTITKAGTYVLCGTLEEGRIVVDTQDEETVKIIFNGVAVSNSKISPITVISAPQRVTIHLQKNSVNKVVDTAKNKNGEYGEDSAIYSKEDLRFTGGGTLAVESVYYKGIVSKDDLEIKNGNISVKSADDCISGKDSVTVTGGTLNLESSGSDAIKSGNNETLGKGVVTIEAGDIYISAKDDGIHAEQQLYIKGGNIVISQSTEGVEGVQIYISGGKTVITASDDGVNACGGNSMMGPGGPGGGGGKPGGRPWSSLGSSQSSSEADVTSELDPILSVSGGYLEISTSSGDTDGIDSNGGIEISGGVVFVKSKSSQGGVAGSIDCDKEITVTGGNVIALGGICETPSKYSTNYTVTFNRTDLKAGTYILKDENGAELLEFELDSNYKSGWISLEAFVKSGKYELLCDANLVVSLTAN